MIYDATHDTIRLYNKWRIKGNHRALAATRYWIRQGFYEESCDNVALQSWLDEWWASLPQYEQQALDRWMFAIHHALIFNDVGDEDTTM